MKYVLFLRGRPATGKITVARVLQKKLDWKLLWLHDLKNAVYEIVREHRIPRLMDEITVPVLGFMLDRGDDIIYVRPAPDKDTVEATLQTVEKYPDYRMIVVRLDAKYDTLLQRAQERQDQYRISNKQDLDEYLSSRPVVDIEEEHIIMTDDLTPEQVADKILQLIKNDK